MSRDTTRESLAKGELVSLLMAPNTASSVLFTGPSRSLLIVGNVYDNVTEYNDVFVGTHPALNQGVTSMSSCFIADLTSVGTQ